MGPIVIYLCPANDDQMRDDLARLAGHTVKCIVMRHRGSYNVVVMAVRELCRHHDRYLVLPDDYRRHNPLIEDVKACAHRLPVPVMPITSFLHKHRPVAASAAPPTQHHAVAGQNPSIPCA